jgi:hypothetical protein
MVAVACDNRVVSVWDFETGDLIKALDEHDWVRGTATDNVIPVGPQGDFCGLFPCTSSKDLPRVGVQQ